MSRRRAAVALAALLALCAACGGRRKPTPHPPPPGGWGGDFGQGKTFEQGEASWYGEEYHGRKTASGERYDMNDLTAAHPSLPFGTVVRVENQSNGRSVVVRINDRGPFKKGRVIDLSYAAADQIGMVLSGVAPVRLVVLPH